MTWTSLSLRKLSLWVLCVMLLGALAPTMSRARAWSQGTQIVGVDTVALVSVQVACHS